MSRSAIAFRRWPGPHQRATDNSLRHSTMRWLAARSYLLRRAAMKAPLLTACASGLLLVSVATPALAGPPVVYPMPYGQGASVPVYTQDTRKERMRRELDVLQQRLEE